MCFFVHQNFWYSLVYQSPGIALVSSFSYWGVCETSRYDESTYEKQQMNYYFSSSINEGKTNFKATWADFPSVLSFSFLIFTKDSLRFPVCSSKTTLSEKMADKLSLKLFFKLRFYPIRWSKIKMQELSF